MTGLRSDTLGPWGSTDDTRWGSHTACQAFTHVPPVGPIGSLSQCSPLPDLTPLQSCASGPLATANRPAVEHGALFLSRHTFCCQDESSCNLHPPLLGTLPRWHKSSRCMNLLWPPWWLALRGLCRACALLAQGLKEPIAWGGGSGI